MAEQIITPSDSGESSTPPTPPESEPTAIVSGGPEPVTKRPKKKALILIVALIIVAVGGGLLAWWFIKKGNANSAYGTMTLSNGKEVQLGQTSDYLEHNLGLTKEVGANVYLFPAQITPINPVQATIFVDSNKIVAIRMIKSTASFQNQTNIHIGGAINQVPQATHNKATALSENIGNGYAKGYTLLDGNTTSYYMVDTCSTDPSKIVVIAVATKGYETSALSTGAGCGLRS